MNILVLGSGAREHALCHALFRSPSVHKIFACPGNGGISQICNCIPFSTNAELIKYASNRVELAVVGSSKFVSSGTVDALVTAGIPVIGPAADAGRIETSKAFASHFLARHNIPAPMTQVVRNIREAQKFIAENPWVKVVKADGFARGTGVAVTSTPEEALEAAEVFFKVNGPPLILQEKLEGIECSYSILTDGNQWVSFSSSQDYKRVFDGETGPTTGGMGSVSPFPDLTPELEESIRQRVVIPTVHGLMQDKLIYRGFLSIQLMLTVHGPRVLEFNARLGDPETQSILARFRGNLATLLFDCSRGCLDATGSEVAFGRNWAVSVVLARAGYPVDESIEPVIRGLDEVKDGMIFHSSSVRSENDGGWKFTSGRLLTVTGVGETLSDAHSACYRDIDRISLQNVHYRTDIGAEKTPSSNT
ncbi:MAG: phosphoribosylamine--glycine ligase [Candidatus Riflebacteria bacterium]|nr:phosphoribosylamine--glycine ligase [Candidatus Riflebacteria bacterium]